MTGAYWHIGLLVYDLEGAVSKFEQALDTRFRPATVADLSGHEEPGRGLISSLAVAYSVDGPPYIELIQAAGSGIFGTHLPEGFHHLGVWSEDNTKREESMRSSGLRRGGRNVLPDGSIQTIFTEPADLHGIRIEYVNEKSRQRIERFMESGLFG